MSTAKVLYQRWINELWSGTPVAAEVVSADFVGHWPDRDVHGPVELQKMVDETRDMLTELAFVIEVEPIEDGDYLAARWIGTGSSHGRPTRFTGNDIMRVGDGRFVEYWTGTSPG